MPQSPNTTDLTSYEEFSRQELPRLFRGALETAIASEKQLAEDRLRNRLVSMIQECQDRVFSLYRSQHEDGIGMSSPISPRSATGTGVTGLGILQSSFQSPPYQVTNCMTFGILDEDDRKSVMPPMEPRTSDLDSGYFSIGLDLNHLVSGNTSKETSELPPWRIELMHGFCDTNLEDSAQSIDCFDDFLVSGGDSSSLSANDDYAFLENGFGDMNSMESNDNVQYDPLAYFPGIQEATER
ncbi:hypothetical protein DL98DRAFT_520946 [Cadophora sp. DSE1049]|nr:hypothetical protein DL98DRAFT_520946 [Cadophora sp. DSE1049]